MLHFCEKNQLSLGFAPVDVSTGANPGDWFDMAPFERLAVVYVGSIGTAGDDPVISLLQSKTLDDSDTSNKALNFTRIDAKEGATSLATVGQFSVVSQAAANSFTGDSGENQKIYVIDIRAEDLDVDGGFRFVKASVAKVGTNAQLGVLLYVGHEPKVAGNPLAAGIV